MKIKSLNIPVYIYFIIATLLIIFFFPREGKFRYLFVEGRPWQYGLLTAPVDLPIYKTDDEIRLERDSLNSNFQPYFHLETEVVQKQLKQFDENFRKSPVHVHESEYKAYIERGLTEVYNAGIVNVTDFQLLRDNQFANYKIFEGNIAVIRPTDALFTIKTAYSRLLGNCPSYLDVEILKTLNLNDYLHENVLYDEVTTEKVKQDMLQKISPSTGMVQAGEKIVDRGEIVDKNIYNTLRSMKLVYEKQQGTTQRRIGTLSGLVILIGGVMLCFFFYFYYLRKFTYERRKDITFILSMVLLFTLLTEICVIHGLFSVYIIPYTIIPIVVRTFFDSRTALMTHLTTILICSLMIPLAFEFVLLQVLVSLIAVYALKDLTQRSELIKCAFYILIAYVVVYLGFILFQEGDFQKLDWNMLLYFGINFIFVMFTYPFIYILEKIFGYISNVTLVELSDINTPILRQLSESCPGTFQHSLQVSMLGTVAATKVGANPQLIRTGAMYHDLGKMLNPHFFIENKIEGLDPHKDLTLEQSAMIITGHVPEGVKIAKKNNIPESIIKFIRTHHGTGKAKFFYNSFKNQFPDKEINEKAFTYCGSNPDTKETAILMMADSVEAASRSLKDYSEETIRNLVNRIIDSQIADGLLNQAPLTFLDITTIKNVFVDRLLTVYHSRISYPDLKEKG
jgi:putative nucleotidyltransferase with HDIG domain